MYTKMDKLSMGRSNSNIYEITKGTRFRDDPKTIVPLKLIFLFTIVQFCNFPNFPLISIERELRTAAVRIARRHVILSCE